MGEDIVYIILECRCNHMSYYTVIEDDAEEIVVEVKRVYKEEVIFTDWPTAAVLIYFSLITIVMLLYSRAKDSESDILLK
jgi:hypothetical protein